MPANKVYTSSWLVGIARLVEHFSGFKFSCSQSLATPAHLPVRQTIAGRMKIRPVFFYVVRVIYFCNSQFETSQIRRGYLFQTVGRIPALTDLPNDDEVLTLASKGDRDAFGMLYERYVDRIFNYVYYRTGNVNDAEDLTARVFQRAMNHIVNYTDRGVPFSAWLYRIAHNLVANWHRDRSRRQEIPLSDAPLVAKGEQPESNLVHTQQQESLLRLIRSLPAERQTLLILKFVEHLSNAEIGEIMGRSEGAVKSLYHRTLLALRDQVGAADEYSD
jgi:RNA polymerase sigma-70 factor, ECF subfamily